MEAQGALDDPLVMAGQAAAGEAFAGEVVDVELERRIGRWAVPRARTTGPLVTVRAPPTRSGSRPATSSCAPARAPQAERLRGRSTGRRALVVLQVDDGWAAARSPSAGSVPEKGDCVCYADHDHGGRPGAAASRAAEETPWTTAARPPRTCRPTRTPMEDWS